MTQYVITYVPTGKHNDTCKVWITDGDEMADGTRVDSIADAIAKFQEVAAKNWKSYENMHAIKEIKVKEI